MDETVRITLRNGEEEVYHGIVRVDDTKTAVLILHQQINQYGARITIRIPWDQIEKVES